MKRQKLSLHVNRDVEVQPVRSLEREIVLPLVEVADAPAGLTEIKSVTRVVRVSGSSKPQPPTWILRW